MMFQIVFHILSLVLETIKKANSTGFIPVYNSRMYSKKNLDFLFLFFLTWKQIKSSQNVMKSSNRENYFLYIIDTHATVHELQSSDKTQNIQSHER